MIVTAPARLELNFIVRAGTFVTDQLAQRLDIAKFDKEDSLAEKLNLPSSVNVMNRSDSTDKIRLRLKEDFPIEGAAFAAFLDDAYKAFPKQNQSRSG